MCASSGAREIRSEATLIEGEFTGEQMPFEISDRVLDPYTYRLCSADSKTPEFSGVLLQKQALSQNQFKEVHVPPDGRRAYDTRRASQHGEMCAAFIVAGVVTWPHSAPRNRKTRWPSVEAPSEATNAQKSIPITCTLKVRE